MALSNKNEYLITINSKFVCKAENKEEAMKLGEFFLSRSNENLPQIIEQSHKGTVVSYQRLEMANADIKDVAESINKALQLFQEEKEVGKAYLEYKNAISIHTAYKKYCSGIKDFAEIFKEAVLERIAQYPSKYEDFNGLYFTMVMNELEDEIKCNQMQS